MQTKQKLITATAILACGFALALLFRKQDSSGTSATIAQQAAADLPLQADAERITYVAPPGEAAEPPATEAQPNLPAPSPTEMAAQLKEIQRPGSPAAPPVIADKYERQLFALAETRDVRSAPAADTAPGADATPSPRLRSHRINDGDTLETLARRYLGDATRWGEIFEANRSSLGDPFQLPIGASLTIPPRETMDVDWPAIRAQRAPQMSIMAPAARRVSTGP